MDWRKTTARRDEKHLSFGIWSTYIRDFTVFLQTIFSEWGNLGWFAATMTKYAKFVYMFFMWFYTCSWTNGTLGIDNRCFVQYRLDLLHDDVIKWKHFPRYWPFVRGIHRSPVNSPHKGQRRGALMFSSICVWINGWVNDCEAGD